MTITTQQQQEVSFEQWGMATSAFIGSPSGAWFEVGCRAAELDSATAASFGDLFNELAEMGLKSDQHTSAPAVYRARIVEADPMVRAAVNWLNIVMPGFEVKSIYIDSAGTLSARDLLYTFTFRYPGLGPRIAEIPVPVFGSMPSGLQSLSTLLGKAPLLAATTELAAGQYAMAIFTAGATFAVYITAPHLEVIQEATTEAHRRWWQQKLNVDSLPHSHTGTVKLFDPAKQFGFIKPDDEGQDVFVHASAITTPGQPSLVAGQRVTYEIGQGRKGPKATNVRITPTS
ncbi:cold-shock protein [Nocardia sp. NPDC056611]|uniref:cold-shock protein n=1 Tax=Nocardia sp. NPDC056611 TaxID=3345877 RepID=UPI003671BE58